MTCPSSGRGFAVVALERPKTALNVGSAIRAAYAFGATMVMYTGERGWHKKIPTDVSKAWRHLPVLQVTDIAGCAPKAATVVAVERISDAGVSLDHSMRDVVFSLPRYRHPARAVYVFGPEDGCVSDELLACCDDIVTIDAGSLNLAAAVNVVLYDRTAKQDLKAKQEWGASYEEEDE